MRVKRFLAAILSVAMMFSMMSFSVSAEESTVSTWDGESYSLDWLEAGNPEGTAGDKFYLNSAEDLAGLAYYVNTYASTNNIFTGDTVYLNVDVDLDNHDWAPIGTAYPREKNRFYGSFDGQGHTISNLKVEEGHYFAGLFGQIPTYTYTQTFSNITINNAMVVAEDETESGKSKEAAGALIGRANGTIIDNCHVTGKVNISGDRFVGGLLGHSYAQISDCSVEATGTINADTWQAGGLVGAHAATATYTASINDCLVNGGENGLAITSYYASAGGALGNVSVSGVDSTPIDGITVKNVSVEADSEDYGSGVALVASGYSATNVTVSNVTTTLANEETVPGDVEATLNGEYCISFYDAVKNAQVGDEIELLTGVTYDVWNAISGKDGITINGNGNTITVTDSVYSNGNGGALLRNASNLTINDLNVVLPATPTPEMERLAIMKSGTLNKVTVTGGTFAVSIVGEGPVEINNCTFEDLGGWAIETEGKATDASLTISNSTFDEAAVILRGENNTFTGNTIIGAGEGVNVLGDAVITGNDFGESTLGIDRGVEVTIEKNIIKNVELSSWLTGDYNVTAENNTLSADAVEILKTVDEDVASVDPVAEIDGKKYHSLADAVAALEDGDTLAIATGTYDAFEVLADDITITGMTDDAEITVGSTTDTAFIGVGGDDVTIEGIKFIIPEEVAGKKIWITSVIGFASSQYNYGGVEPDGWDVTDCEFIQEGDALGIAIFNCNSFTVDGCTFENFGTGISSMGDGSALGTVAITDNTFTKVNAPINVYWGQPGDENGSLTITGNTFASAKDADEIEIAIDDFASRQVGTSGIDSLELSGNAFNAATNVIIVDASASVAEDVKEDLANADNVVIDERYAAVARIGDDKYFTSLEAAIAGAQTVDTIDLLGNTIEINVYQDSYHAKKSLTFKNGTLDFSYAGAPTALFWLSGSQQLAFENVNLIKRDVGTDRKYMYNLIQVASPNAIVSFTDCTIDFDGAYDSTNKVGMASSYIANDGNGKMYFTNCDIECEYTNFVYRGGATFDNCTFDGFADLDEGDASGNIILWAANPCVIKNSTVYTRQLGSISANGTIAITENSYVYAERVRHYYATDSANYIAGLVTVDATSILEAVELDMGMISEDSEGIINSEASAVYVQYKKVDVDADGNDTVEGSDKYEIVLAGANNNAASELINELASADLTFNFVGTPVNGGAMDYTVAPAEGVTLTQLGDRYMFNYDGVTKYEESGAAIVIGTITIDGYGSYTLATADSEYNAVYATEIKDNIVDGYEDAAALVINTDLFADDNMVGEITDGVIAVPTRTLTINITFPNAVVDNDIAYQDMKVEITGNIDGVNKTVIYNLGEDEVAMVNGSYVVTEDKLVLNNAYTVTVSGAGYRTARYTVTMTDDKELKFWNNVMDEAQVVEIGKDSSAVKVTFLAGDIVKDNNINIYDLSAVVSYFGTEDCVNSYPEYAKYDLNRDGVIDSKDVAYVLVSWNN